MSIFTIGDLHLSFHDNKPMNIFGDNWLNHDEKIKESWTKNVKEDDLVVLPGDFSWSTYLKDTYEDFRYLNSLPGKKLLLKGNHDYWWTTLNSMNNFLKTNEFNNISFIYNTAYKYKNKIIVGTRGWGKTENKEEDLKMFNRENSRLELSIKKALEIKDEKDEIIAFIHYPPITKSNIINNTTSIFIDTLKKYEIKKCYYAHLHSESIKEAIEGNYFGIDFKLVSADALDFKILKIIE